MAEIYRVLLAEYGWLFVAGSGALPKSQQQRDAGEEICQRDHYSGRDDEPQGFSVTRKASEVTDSVFILASFGAEGFRCLPQAGGGKARDDEKTQEGSAGCRQEGVAARAGRNAFRQSVGPDTGRAPKDR